MFDCTDKHTVRTYYRQVIVKFTPNIIQTTWGNPMSNTMSYKGYSARIEYDDDDGIFTGRVAGIRDGVGFHAGTVEGLQEAFHEAVEDYIEVCAKVGKEPQKAFLAK